MLLFYWWGSQSWLRARFPAGSAGRRPALDRPGGRSLHKTPAARPPALPRRLVRLGALTHSHKRWDGKYVTLVLASQSPRRAEILRQAGLPFTVRVAQVDETPLPGEPPVAYAERLAARKAAAVDAAPDEIVIGADTTVVTDGHMLGKPAGVAAARRMLSLLSGRRHQVITGICLRRGAERMVDHAITAVWFAPMSEREIAGYAASGEIGRASGRERG